jgi:hypothetical protein
MLRKKHMGAKKLHSAIDGSEVDGIHHLPHLDMKT